MNIKNMDIVREYGRPPFRAIVLHGGPGAPGCAAGLCRGAAERGIPVLEHNGYMTEAVRAMCSWAKEQEGVSCITAETEADGFASQHILKRCGFTEYARNDTIWWRMQPE